MSVTSLKYSESFIWIYYVLLPSNQGLFWLLADWTLTRHSLEHLLHARCSGRPGGYNGEEAGTNEWLEFLSGKPDGSAFRPLHSWWRLWGDFLREVSRQIFGSFPQLSAPSSGFLLERMLTPFFSQMQSTLIICFIVFISLYFRIGSDKVLCSGLLALSQDSPKAQKPTVKLPSFVLSKESM